MQRASACRQTTRRGDLSHVGTHRNVACRGRSSTGPHSFVVLRMDGAVKCAPVGRCRALSTAEQDEIAVGIVADARELVERSSERGRSI